MKSGISFISFASKEFHIMSADKGYLALDKVMPLSLLFHHVLHGNNTIIVTYNNNIIKIIRNPTPGIVVIQKYESTKKNSLQKWLFHI